MRTHLTHFCSIKRGSNKYVRLRSFVKYGYGEGKLISQLWNTRDGNQLLTKCFYNKPPIGNTWFKHPRPLEFEYNRSTGHGNSQTSQHYQTGRNQVRIKPYGSPIFKENYLIICLVNYFTNPKNFIIMLACHRALEIEESKRSCRPCL